MIPCEQTGGRTDMTKLIVAFRNFAKVPKNNGKITRRDCDILTLTDINIMYGNKTVLSMSTRLKKKGGN